MGTIFKRERVWYLDVRANGRRIRKRVGRDKKTALLALQDAEVKIARNEFGFARNDIFIDKFLVQYLDYSRANHRLATLNRYRAVMDHFKEFLKSKPDIGFLSQITPEVIDQYKMFRKNAWVNPNGKPIETEIGVGQHTRKGARAHTINFELGVLRTMLNLAVKWSYMKDNPATQIKALKVDDSKPERFLSEKECTKFLNACPPDLRPIYFTFLNTGMRKAELENLEWDDVDLKRRKIRIRRKEFWQPKTGERVIPINDKLLELLTEIEAKNGKSLKSNFVFPDSSGGMIKTKLRERLIKIAIEAKIPNLTKLHTLRHTFASQLVMAGVDLPTVNKLMGHTDIKVTMIYAHLAEDHLADAVNKLSF